MCYEKQRVYFQATRFYSLIALYKQETLYHFIFHFKNVEETELNLIAECAKCGLPFSNIQTPLISKTLRFKQSNNH
jgi:hypothetical protein